MTLSETTTLATTPLSLTPIPTLLAESMELTLLVL